MAVTTTKTNKPLNPRGNDQSPKGYNRAELYTGKALDFDGVNDYVDIGSFSMSGNNATFVFNYNQDAAASGKFVFDNEGARLSIGQGDVSGSFGVDTGSIAWEYFGSLESGKWYGIAVIIEGSTARCYANGVAFGDAVDIGETLNFANVTNATIGARYSKTASNFDGQLSGFKIFNTALTAAQVADLYNNPEKIVPTGVADSALKLWLPMMEGAGTTAYDGSGNGNHGTISGATWTHGIGAPVAQTAVIDWNKGTNLLGYTDISNAYWTKSGGTLTTGIEAPDGTNTAFKFERDDSSSGTIYNVAPAGLGSTNYRYVYAKLPSGSASASAQLMSHNTNTNNTFTITDEWQRFEVNSAPNTAPTNFYIIDFRGGVGVDEIHLWAPQAAVGTDESVFVPTIGTAQTSPVLLPQGLTTGRDITGVNLFENVRKQGALNLDGNSWAEVHDNASLDITDEVTLECWLYHTDTTKLEHIIGKRASSGSWLRIYSASTNTLRVERDGGAATSNISITENAWSHIVATIDTSNVVRFYINGTQQTSKLNFTPWGLDNAAPVSLGAWVTESGAVSSNSYESGQIAQPRIYDRALTAEEVERNYNAGKNIYK